MKLRSWTAHRFAVATLALAIGLAPLGFSAADIQGGLVNGYSDAFDYPNVTLAQNAALDPARWQTFPVASNGAPVANVWVVGGVQTSTVGIGGEIKALKQRTTATPPNDPIAFVRNGNWQNMVVQVRAAFEGPSVNSGIGIVFRSPVDPLTGSADRNNFYLFTAVTQTPDPQFCTTGRCVALFKRVGGAYFRAAVKPTYLNFTNPNGPAESHLYKIVMSGNRIQAFVDGLLLIEVEDSPGDDIVGTSFAMPGPMIANGTVGLRTSGTRAWFDDFVVMGDSDRAYEGRAAAVSTYGQVGAGANGTVVAVTGADTNFQYHDHDFPQGNSTEGTFVGPAAPGSGFTGGALVQTKGTNGTTTSNAQLVGFSGTMTQAMPDGNSVSVTILSDTISASASASCEATSTNVKLLNFSYLIVVRNPNGIPLLSDGKTSEANPPPNTTIADPNTNGGYVRITLNYQKVTADPRRADVSAVRIDFLQRKLAVQSGESTIADTGVTTAVVMLSNVVAGRLCTPFF